MGQPVYRDDDGNNIEDSEYRELNKACHMTRFELVAFRCLFNNHNVVFCHWQFVSWLPQFTPITASTLHVQSWVVVLSSSGCPKVSTNSLGYLVAPEIQHFGQSSMASSL